MMSSLRFCIGAAAAIAACAGSTLAQSNPPPRSVPFTENFSAGVPSNFVGWNGINGNSTTSQAAAEASVPTGNASPILGAPSTTGGLFYDAGAGNIGHTYSTNATNGANQWAFAINTTGATGLTLAYDLSTFNVQGRPAQMVAQYRVGHSGGWTTLPTVAGNPYTSGALSEVVHVSIILPTDAENQPEVQIRFANWRGAGSGSSSRYTTDNVSVTSGSVDPNIGACCEAIGTCSATLVGTCTTGTFLGAGTSCSPNVCPQPSGSCCILGTGCILVNSPAECTTAGGNGFVVNGLCNPGPCIPPAPVAVQGCDIAYAANNAAAGTTLFQIRGAGSASPALVGSWAQNPFIEFVRFDNTGGTNHNAHGNMLGLNFGNAGGGGPLYSYATDGSNNSQLLLDAAGFNSIINLPANPRVGGLSVSPNNDRIAVTGYDAAAIAVFTYHEGLTPGTGSGAFISGGAALTSLAYLANPKGTYGTAWLDNDTLLVFVPMGGQVVKLYSIAVSGVDSATTFGAPVERASFIDPGADVGRVTAVAYNPQQSSYVFALSSAFQSPTTTNTLYVIDPATWTVAKQLNLSASLQTARDLAIGCDHNLYISSRVEAGRSQISKLVLDADASGTISAGEIAALTDNSTTDFYTNSLLGIPSFSGIDVAITGVVTLQGACCNAASGVCSPSLTAALCATQGGVYQGDNSACSPNPCPQPQTGVCCRGATCNTTFTSATACSSSLTGSPTAGAFFVSNSTTCNTGAVSNAPCCYANYNKVNGISVQDIFDFLSDWFAGFPYANVGNTGNTGPLAVQNIFDFLSNWFAGGC